MLKVLLKMLMSGAFLLSTASVVFGLVSWCVLPKWRQFRHYVFINTLLTYPVYVAFYITVTSKHLRHLVAFTLFLTFAHWLMVTTVMFYIEFVKVFTSLEAFGHLYLKVNIFGWLLPVVLAVLFDSEVSEVLQLLVGLEFIVLFTSNVVLYVCVVRALWKQSRVRSAGPGGGVCTRLILFTFAFICTGALHTLASLTVALDINATDVVVDLACNIGACLYGFAILCINVFFLILKSHRELWPEHWYRKHQAALNAASIP